MKNTAGSVASTLSPAPPDYVDDDLTSIRGITQRPRPTGHRPGDHRQITARVLREARGTSRVDTLRHPTGGVVGEAARPLRTGRIRDQTTIVVGRGTSDPTRSDHGDGLTRAL